LYKIIIVLQEMIAAPTTNGPPGAPMKPKLVYKKRVHAKSSLCQVLFPAVVPGAPVKKEPTSEKLTPPDSPTHHEVSSTKTKEEEGTQVSQGEKVRRRLF
jgi:hypothetical protein